MKIQRSNIVILFFMLCSYFLNGQSVEFGLHASGGVSWLNMDKDIYSTEVRPSASVGFFGEKRFNEKWGLKSGLFLNYLKSQGWTSTASNSPDFLSGSYLEYLLGINDEWTPDPVLGGADLPKWDGYENDMLYVGLPISVFYQIKGVSFSGGFQMMRLSFAGVRHNGQYDELRGVSKWDYGPTGGVDVRVSEKMNIVSNIYLGLKNIRGKLRSFTRKNRQITIGLNYYLS